MSDALIIALSTISAALISVGATFLVIWFNRKKTSAEAGNLNVDSNLKGGELANRYLDIAERQAKKNEDLETDNMELKKQVEALQSDVEELKKARIADREEFRKAFEDERNRTQKIIDDEHRTMEEIKDYNGRLKSQLESWRIVPVPFDINRYKEELKKSCIDGSEIMSENK